MNTNLTTTPDVTAAPAKKSTGRLAAGLTAAAVAGAAICGVAVFAFGGFSSPAANGASSTPSHSATGGSTGGGSITPVIHHKGTHSGSHAIAPSNSIKELQRQLGQLNYYEGPVDGYDGPATVAAIKDLQRDAHLPQTGVMNTATSNALKAMLIHGNNVMGAI